MRLSKILKTTKGIKKISDESDEPDYSEIQISGSRALPLMGEMEGALFFLFLFLIHQIFCNLDSVEGCAFADLVASEPKR